MSRGSAVVRCFGFALAGGDGGRSPGYGTRRMVRLDGWRPEVKRLCARCSDFARSLGWEEMSEAEQSCAEVLRS